uniref:Cilia- and flagella-associated protein 58 central coiled coil domain-containing protein n=1 Tax=Periophthalmus magnuspinnatus TaxID=409849 RepID=A0A3B3Z7M5_9GOBI
MCTFCVISADLESAQKQVDADKKAIDELTRERDILNKNIIKAAVSTEKQQSLVKLLEQDKKTLEHEILGYRQEAQKQRQIIHQLEKERDRHINETSNLMHKARTVEGSVGRGLWEMVEGHNNTTTLGNLTVCITTSCPVGSMRFVQSR